MNWTTVFDWIVATCVFAVIFLVWALAAYADQPLVTVYDGDTIRWAGEPIRLHGADAPELDQPGGIAARDWLIEKITGYPIRIDRRGKDQYNRTIAIVYVGSKAPGDTTIRFRSVNKAIVLDGNAWAYREHSTTYVGDEIAARKAERGLWWPGSCPQAPWHWREDHK